MEVLLLLTYHDLLLLVVFMSPETATSLPWIKLFSTSCYKRNLVLIAVDEAHCISDWLVKYGLKFVLGLLILFILIDRGTDFRVAFSKLGSLRAQTSVPFMALTATASSDTQQKIVESLHLVEPVIVSGILNRPNIFLSTSPIKSLAVSICALLV